MIGDDAIMLHTCAKFGPDMGETCTAPHTEYTSVIHHVVMNLPPLTICLPQHLMTRDIMGISKLRLIQLIL